MAAQPKRRQRLLSSSRPRTAKPTTSLSSSKTRSLVRNYHNLRKQLSLAVWENDTAKVDSIEKQINQNGGLRKYQEASIQGQSPDRGGDTSKMLIKWLAEHTSQPGVDANAKKLKLLEVGALRVDNACSKSPLLQVERIDLHSQHAEIKEQDFMSRPIPNAAEIDDGFFDIVSLSLVVNFVTNRFERGDMLKRVGCFLRHSQDEKGGIFPALFLVLPAFCVTNSRYLDEDRLKAIMQSLGYTLVERKMSAKLVFYLWRFSGMESNETTIFKKEEVRSGRSRNNFAISLR